MDSSLILEGFQLIKKDLQLTDKFDDGMDPSFDRLLQWLTEQVRVLLDKDFASLLNAIYRIDVDEDRVKEVLALRDPETLAPNLAQLILDRQLCKAETRRRYSSE